MGGQKSPDRNFKPTWRILKVTFTIQGALCTEGLIGRNLSFSQILVKKEFPQVRSLYISLSFCFQILMKIPRDELPAVWLDETSVSHRQASGSECTPSPGEQFLPSLRGKWDPYGGSGLLEFLLRKPASWMKNKGKKTLEYFSSRLKINRKDKFLFQKTTNQPSDKMENKWPVSLSWMWPQMSVARLTLCF